jgi:alkanesulfonate monooxygenase SsuD/methylene tetrahydromethanopterin reductase-like flavin-dependent oxidoreductase (luciferase family)
VITFGICPFPQTAPYAALAERARRAEALGFDSIWLADESAMSYPDVIASEAWTLLAALAVETERVTLGTLVTPVSFRHPLINAMLVSGLDHVSAGRAAIGLGAGNVPKDLAGLGLGDTSPRDLVDRLDEQASIVDALLRGEMVTRADGFYRLQDAVVERPIQQPRPPIVIGAQGPRAIRVAARHADVWNTVGGQPIGGEKLSQMQAVEATRRQIEALEEECVRIGRDPLSIRRSVIEWRVDIWSSDHAFTDWVGTYRDLGFQDFVVFWPEDKVRLEQVASAAIPTLRL